MVSRQGSIRSREEKHLLIQGVVREVSLKKGNLGSFSSIKGASHVNWRWPWGNWGHCKGGIIQTKEQPA